MAIPSDGKSEIRTLVQCRSSVSARGRVPVYYTVSSLLSDCQGYKSSTQLEPLHFFVLHDLIVTAFVACPWSMTYTNSNFITDLELKKGKAALKTGDLVKNGQ